MQYGFIVSDWNGTLTSSTEEASNKKIGYRMKDDTLRAVSHGQVWKIPRLLKLLDAKKKTEEALAAYNRGEVPLSDVYEPFNSAIEGAPVDYINEIVDEFARETVWRVDGRLLRPIAALHEKGSRTGILSVAYRGVIKRTLAEAGYRYMFDHIVANSLERTANDRAIGFTLDIYERKGEAMKDEFFDTHGFRPEETIYLGDDLKDDGPVADLLPPGHFVVPFLATDDVKQEFAAKRKAFVPESEADLQRYLEAKLRF